MSFTVNGTTGITFPNNTTQNTAASGFGFHNRLINGDMRIDQRNAGASVTIPASTTTYTVDRWGGFGSQASKFSVQQNAGSVTPPAGFKNYVGCTSLSAYTVGTSELFILIQNIEGFNAADLDWGTANAKTVTLSFWVRSSLTGTFGGYFSNSAQNRSYPFSYTISSANTWEQKFITVVGDTTGTWLTNNGIGIQVGFNLGSGSTFSGTANTWAGAFYSAPTGATSVVGTNGATFYITGVQLEKDSVATSFDYRPYGTELALCQRYYWKIAGDNSDYPSVGSGVVQSASSGRIHIKHPVSMRTYPTFSYGGTLNIDHGGYFQTAVTSINGAYEGLDTSMLDFGASGGGLTAGRGAVVYCNNASTNFLQASAEL